tara:strand:- start:67 stop:447 length:381 start_codon:yes stop_codon:yes gene_type:complete
MKKKNQNRSFGLLFFIVFLGFGLWPITKGESINLILSLISLVFLILGILNSKILTPLNKIWVKFGEILGLFVAPIVMGIIYFLILTPISILVRIFGKDLLKIKFSNKVNSYWIKRHKKPGSMKKQF